MKKLLLAMFVALLMVGCGSPDLDDKETLDGIIAEAIDYDTLEFRAASGLLPLLIPCKACKKEVSKSGEVCPNCSHPIADSVRAYKDGLSEGRNTSLRPESANTLHGMGEEDVRRWADKMVDPMPGRQA